jgi:SPP1 gp7 family putative phage head morphogenesis protein
MVEQLMNMIVELRKRVKKAKAQGRKYRLRKPTRIKHPLSLEREYQKKLRGMSKEFSHLVETHLFPQLSRIVKERDTHEPKARANSMRFNSWAGEVGKTMDSLVSVWDAKYDTRDIAAIATREAALLSAWNEREVLRSLSRMAGFTITLDEPWLQDKIDTFTEENVHLITTIAENQHDDVKELCLREIKAGTRVEEIQDMIRDRFKISEGRANLIGRDQVSKFHAALNEARQKEAGVTKYRWRGTLDERERDSHLAHEGEVYEWGESPADTGAPGEDYQCRCWAEPVIEAEEIGLAEAA